MSALPPIADMKWQFATGGDLSVGRSFLQLARRQHHDPRTHRRALVKVDDVLVDHADATRGNAPADGPRLNRAVDAVECILVALPEVHGTRTEWIA
jgi:hypothetical protein